MSEEDLERLGDLLSKRFLLYFERANEDDKLKRGELLVEAVRAEKEIEKILLSQPLPQERIDEFRDRLQNIQDDGLKIVAGKKQSLSLPTTSDGKLADIGWYRITHVNRSGVDHFVEVDAYHPNLHELLDSYVHVEASKDFVVHPYDRRNGEFAILHGKLSHLRVVRASLSVAYALLDREGLSMALFDIIKTGAPDKYRQYGSKLAEYVEVFDSPLGFSVKSEHPRQYVNHPNTTITPLWSLLQNLSDDSILHNIGLLGFTVREISRMLIDSESFSRDKYNNLEQEIDHKIYSLGRLVEKLLWKYRHEEAAKVGYSRKSADETRGKGGEKTSKERRKNRAKAMLNEMIKLVKQNPTLRRDDEIEIAKRAVTIADERDPSLWVQGKGQYERYLDIAKPGGDDQELIKLYVEFRDIFQTA